MENTKKTGRDDEGKYMKAEARLPWVVQELEVEASAKLW
jgi:hypothetical protein